VGVSLIFPLADKTSCELWKPKRRWVGSTLVGRLRTPTATPATFRKETQAGEIFSVVLVKRSAFAVARRGEDDGFSPTRASARSPSCVRQHCVSDRDVCGSRVDGWMTGRFKLPGALWSKATGRLRLLV